MRIACCAASELTYTFRRVTPEQLCAEGFITAADVYCLPIYRCHELGPARLALDPADAETAIVLTGPGSDRSLAYGRTTDAFMSANPAYAALWRQHAEDPARDEYRVALTQA